MTFRVVVELRHDLVGPGSKDPSCDGVPTHRTDSYWKKIRVKGGTFYSGVGKVETVRYDPGYYNSPNQTTKEPSESSHLGRSINVKDWSATYSMFRWD